MVRAGCSRLGDWVEGLDAKRTHAYAPTCSLTAPQSAEAASPSRPALPGARTFGYPLMLPRPSGADICVPGHILGYEVGLRNSEEKRFLHPEVGELSLCCQMVLDPDQMHTLLVFTA